MGIRTVIQGGVDRFLGKGFELQLGSEALHFETEDQFKIFLKSRANVSAETLAQLKEMPVDRLDRQLQRNERIYKYTLGLLLQVAERGTSVDMLWRELDISELPDEQQWPAILFGVSSSRELSDDLKRESIERFVEFLRARKALLLKLRELAGAPRIERHQDTAEFEAAVDNKPPPDDEIPEDLTGAAMTRGRDYCRIPADDDVVIGMVDEQRINLYLSRWKITLCMRSGAVFVEEDGNMVPLRRGENSVGRSAGCEVPVTGAPMDVSRRHLIINWLGGGKVLLRDVSSKGTWLPREFLNIEPRTEMVTGR
ncbi:MAG TPA: FHA domain-containing protein [Gammaproteobacteria bacterium]